MRLWAKGGTPLAGNPPPDGLGGEGIWEASPNLLHITSPKERFTDWRYPVRRQLMTHHDEAIARTMGAGHAGSARIARSSMQE